jgi:predicted ester cyclase
MASKIDILKAWNAAGNKNPASAETAGYLTDDFQNKDKDGKFLMDKQAYIGMGALMASAFTGLKFVFTDLREEGDAVVATFHTEGTHTGPLDLSAMGMGVVPPSGKMIVWPDRSSRFLFSGDKISGIQDLAEGGMQSFFAPLGVKPPSE